LQTCIPVVFTNGFILKPAGIGSPAKTHSRQVYPFTVQLYVEKKHFYFHPIALKGNPISHSDRFSHFCAAHLHVFS
jgi:mannose/cellobiose epimerase-like protein (N-acyl-D-glucosamine 2-epimerase family)